MLHCSELVRVPTRVVPGVVCGTAITTTGRSPSGSPEGEHHIHPVRDLHIGYEGRFLGKRGHDPGQG
jgi:hypothetical protein